MPCPATTSRPASWTPRTVANTPNRDAAPPTHHVGAHNVSFDGGGEEKAGQGRRQLSPRRQAGGQCQPSALSESKLYRRRLHPHSGGIRKLISSGKWCALSIRLPCLEGEHKVAVRPLHAVLPSGTTMTLTKFCAALATSRSLRISSLSISLISALGPHETSCKGPKVGCAVWPQ